MYDMLNTSVEIMICTMYMIYYDFKQSTMPLALKSL